VGESQCPLVERRELSPVAVGLLEVEANELLVFKNSVADLCLEPVRVPLVEVGAELLRSRGIGGVADEHVREAEAVVAGELGAIWTDQLLANEREQARADLVLFGAGYKLGDRASVEAAAFDGCTLDHRPVGGLEPVDAGCEEGAERRRHEELAVCAEILGLERQQLLDEERVALGRFEHLARVVSGKVRS
jgi:hypothetical protein